jgi:hypothetical protein
MTSHDNDDDRDVDDRILEAPDRGPVSIPPADPASLDPVPEPLRPTPWRLTVWTGVVIGLFLLVGGFFFLGEVAENPNPATATNPPANQTGSAGSG